MAGELSSFPDGSLFQKEIDNEDSLPLTQKHSNSHDAKSHLNNSAGLQRFINVLFAMTPEERKVFLQFLIGCRSSPSGAVAINLDPLLAIVRIVNDDSGCVNVRYYEALLHLAARHNHVGVAKYLIFVKGINANAKNLMNNSTALHVGAKNGHLEVVKLLVEEKVNINATGKNYGLTPLYLAISNRRFEVSDFLIKNGANVNTANSFYWTPLHFAAYYGFPLKIVEALIAKGADINAKENTNRKTALYLAAEHNHLEILNILIANGADLNYPDRTGRTPLHVAASKGYLEIAKCLLNEGAEIDAKLIADGITPLHIAVAEGHLEVVELLLAEGADVNALLDNGAVIGNVRRSSLHISATRFDDQITKVLLKYGADINATNHKGNTALNLAVQKRIYNLKVVRKLLEYGPDINIGNRESRTSLDNAISDQVYAKLLIKYTLLKNFKDYDKIVNLSPYKSCENYTELSSYLDSCVCEISEMKTNEIKESLSLYEFVANDFNVHLLCNINLSVKLAKIDYSVRYPVYNDIILDKLKRFLVRGDLLDKLTKIQFYTYKLDIMINQDVKEKNIILDHDSMDNIIEYLSNGDLLNLLTAFDDSKKRIIDTDTTNHDIKRARLE